MPHQKRGSSASLFRVPEHPINALSQLFSDLLSVMYYSNTVLFNCVEQAYHCVCFEYIKKDLYMCTFLWVFISVCAYVHVPPFLCVWVCVVSMVQLTHPYKTGREPSFLLINLAPPPVLVGGVQHLDDVTGLKRQLPVRHGHMIPYRLSVDD